jgi:hypothetical protein
MSSAALLALAAAGLCPPTAAPPVFASGKSITFRSPAGAWICPLPKDWIGSDHGTTLFLERPRSCERQGYPSSERNYYGSPATCRIEVFYWYWMGEDEPAYRCHRSGTLTFMGKARSLCLIRHRGMVTFWSQARYFADIDAAISISLVTHPARMSADLKLFRQWARGVRACRIHDKDAKGKSIAYGPAPDCPKEGVFF